MKKIITELILFVVATTLIRFSGRIHESHEYIGYCCLLVGIWILSYYWDFKS